MRMHAMELRKPGSPLRLVERDIPAPVAQQIIVEVAACGVCRTDLHVVDGDIHGKLPIVPGHEIVGRVSALGPDVSDLKVGDRVGIPWLGRSCGRCRYCRSGQENLCDDPLFTGFTRDGGFATHALADARYCLPIPDGFDDLHAAPLLCAGLIGYRALTMAGDAERIGFYGFGASAHILAQVAIWQGREVYAFTRQGDRKSRQFARSLGCVWAGSSEEPPALALDAAIIFAPIGTLVPLALRAVRKGGRVICAGIHMTDIPAFPYADLWQERSIRSVANLTRADGRDFLAVAAKAPIATTVTRFALADANQALEALRAGALDGAAVLVP